MWLNPLKGAHLTLGQLDKTLPVDMSAVATVGGESVKVNEKIERGSIVFIKAGTTGKDTACFQLYTSTEAGKPNAVPYVALMGVKDFQAGMAGTNGQAPGNDPGVVGADKATAGGDTWLGKSDVVGYAGPKGPRITAISLVQPAEWETNAFEPEAGSLTYYVGQPLTVSDAGKLTPWEAGKNIVGYVTAVPAPRWINDLGASADAARISGGYAKVIAFSTAWIPVAATGGDNGNVKPLKVGAPKVVGAEAPAAPAADAKAPAAPAAPAADAKAPAAPAAPATAEAPKAPAAPAAPAGVNKPQGK